MDRRQETELPRGVGIRLCERAQRVVRKHIIKPSGRHITGASRCRPVRLHTSNTALDTFCKQLLKASHAWDPMLLRDRYRRGKSPYARDPHFLWGGRSLGAGSWEGPPSSWNRPRAGARTTCPRRCAIRSMEPSARGCEGSGGVCFWESRPWTPMPSPAHAFVLALPITPR